MELASIRRLCRMHNISLRQLEQEAGVGNGVIARWERSNPRLDVLKRVADYFKVSIDDLL